MIKAGGLKSPPVFVWETGMCAKHTHKKEED